jgi:lysophospholipase L1-like esterase
MSNLFNRSRRDFIKTTAIGTVASLSIPQIVSAAMPTKKGKKIELHKGDVLLLQGDSITDWGRSRTENTGHTLNALGNGYSFFTAGKLLSQYPEKSLTIFNRGISGNKVYQLAERWDADCLNLKPNVLSIMIGVNDFWHTLTNGYKGTVETYHSDFVKLLDATKQALPDVKLIIGEPFFVNGIRPEDAKWHPAFDEYQKAAREIAETYNAAFVPYQSIFNEAVKVAPPKYWVNDGVHPNIAGQNLMAQALMETIKG